jgi:hypothetical protein
LRVFCESIPAIKQRFRRGWVVGIGRPKRQHAPLHGISLLIGSAANRFAPERCAWLLASGVD